MILDDSRIIHHRGSATGQTACADASQIKADSRGFFRHRHHHMRTRRVGHKNMEGLRRAQNCLSASGLGTDMGTKGNIVFLCAA